MANKITVQSFFSFKVTNFVFKFTQLCTFFYIYDYNTNAFSFDK